MPFKDETITLDVLVSYVLIAVLGPTDIFAQEITTQTRTTTKQVVSTFKEFGFKTASSYETKTTAGFSLPVKGVSLNGSVDNNLKASFEASFKQSCSQENSSETEKSHQTKRKTTYNGEDGKEKRVLMMKYSIGNFVYKSQTILAYGVEGKDLVDKTTKLTLTMIVTSPYFKLKNGNGHFLAVAGNDLKNESPCVWENTGETGQIWKWEGSHICSALGEKYIAVSENKGATGAGVILWDKTDELGQEWVRDEDGYIRGGKGHYLAVNENKGKGSELCVWSKTNEGGQKWNEVKP